MLFALSFIDLFTRFAIVWFCDIKLKIMQQYFNFLILFDVSASFKY